MPEDAIAAVLLTSVALQILGNLGFVLNALLGLEDEIIFPCLIQ